MTRSPIPERIRQTAYGRSRPLPTGGVAAVGSVLAAVAVATAAAVRLGRNAPTVDLQVAHGVAEPLSVAVPAVVAVAVGAVADTGWEQVGLVTAGTFALLAAWAPAASVPASGALAMAAVLVVAAATTRPDGVRAAGRLLFGVAAAAAVVVAAAANLGVLPAGGRALATTLAFAAFAAAPVAVGVSRAAGVAGVAAGGVVLATALSAPFVTGAAFLAAMAAYDPSVVLAAAGVGGAVAAAVHGVLRRRPTTAAGGVLLVAAGVPASAGRALAVVLGVYLLVGSHAASGGGDGR